MAFGTKDYWNLLWKRRLQLSINQELYPSKEEKGARLGYSLISDHAFVDGNKRIGMYIMLTFLEVNGIRMEDANEKVADVGLRVAAGVMDYDSLLEWVRAHRLQRSSHIQADV